MKLGKEILHPIHPNHKLKLEFNETPFKCDGCKEIGIGVQYTCKNCNFDLHKACALANSPATHSFYPKCEFKLYARPPGPSLRVCDACRQVVRGLVYHCNKCDFDLHPCCMSLPKFLEGGDRNFYLCAKITNSCFCCGGKGLGWSYQSESRNCSVHVCCVKELLVESWHAMYYNVDKRRMKDFQMRVPKIRGPVKNHHRCQSKGKLGKVEKCCQVAGSAIKIVISAILGDTSSIIAGVIGGLLSN